MRTGPSPPLSINVQWRWENPDEDTLRTRNYKTKLPPLGWVKSLNLCGRQYCTFSPGSKWERWAGLARRRRWTSRERPRTQRWRYCLSGHGRKGRAPWAQVGCTDPVFSGPEMGQKMPEGEAQAVWVVQHYLYTTCKCSEVWETLSVC